MLVDASVLITTAEIDSFRLLEGLAGRMVVPATVVDEVTRNPAERAVNGAIDAGWLFIASADEVARDEIETAASHLGLDDPGGDYGGDVAVLAIALARGHAVVVSDDKPLRRPCKTLSVPVSGSIGVLVRGVERGDLRPERAKAKLLAMDEVGARLSASLLRRAERLIDDAADR